MVSTRYLAVLLCLALLWGCRCGKRDVTDDLGHRTPPSSARGPAGQRAVTASPPGSIVPQGLFGVVSSGAFSPDGRRLALAGDRIALIDLDTGVIRAHNPAAFSESGSSLFFHPGGRGLFARNGSFVFWDLARDVSHFRAVSLFTRQHDLPSPLGQALSPDGSLVAYTTSERTIFTTAILLPDIDSPELRERDRLHLWSTDEARDVVVVPFEGGTNPIYWSPHSEMLAVVNAGIHVIDAGTGTELALLPERPGEIFQAAWDPSGRGIAILERTGRWQVVDPLTGDVALEATTVRDSTFGISPDGRWIAFFPGYGGTEVRVIDGTTGADAWRCPITGPVYGTAWIGFEPALSMSTNDDGLVRLDLGGCEITTLASATEAPTLLAVSSDGARMAVYHHLFHQGGTDALSVRDGETGAVMMRLPTRWAASISPFWHPDGHQLVTQSDRGAAFWGPDGASVVDRTQACEAGCLELDPGGTFVAFENPTGVRVVRRDSGQWLDLQLIFDGEVHIPVATSEGGHFCVPEAHFHQLLFRRAGPLLEAEIVDPAASAMWVPDLVERFWAGEPLGAR